MNNEKTQRCIFLLSCSYEVQTSLMHDNKKKKTGEQLKSTGFFVSKYCSCMCSVICYWVLQLHTIVVQ